MPVKHPMRTMSDRIARLECLGEIEGFEKQLSRDGRKLTPHEKIELQKQKARLKCKS